MKQTTISLYERNKEILEFFCKNKIVLSESIQRQLLEFMSRMCTYEEEEKKIYPYVIIGHNIESDSFERIFPAEKIHMSSETNDELFLKNIKPMLPFCNNGWRVYINISEKKLDYGIIRNFSGIEGLIIDDLLTCHSKEEYSLLYNEYGISCVLLAPTSESSFEIVGMDGERLCVNFSLMPRQEGAEEQKQHFVEDILMSVNDERIYRSIRKVVDLFPMKLHGTICLVVNSECQLPNEQLKDGIFLDEPIDLLKIIEEILDKNINHSPDNIRRLNEEYYAITGIFIEMLNFDGITIVDNKGKIRAYNVFITPDGGKSIVTGGARKRAAEALYKSNNSEYVGVYFQSQDGNFSYERIKG